MSGGGIGGAYFEACRWAGICSCRMVDGRPGSGAQYRYCQFAIGWSVTEGRHGDIDLGGRHAVMVGYWDEDEPGAPWRGGGYVDSGASDKQRAALGRIVPGREGRRPWTPHPLATSDRPLVPAAARQL